MSKHASVGAMTMAAGRRAIDYYVDTGECLFCASEDHGGQHEDHCEFFGMSREDLVRALAVLDATAAE